MTKINIFGAPIARYIEYIKHKVYHKWPVMARLLNAAHTYFGPPGIFKWEGLRTVRREGDVISGAEIFN